MSETRGGLRIAWTRASASAGTVWTMNTMEYQINSSTVNSKAASDRIGIELDEFRVAETPTASLTIHGDDERS